MKIDPEMALFPIGSVARMLGTDPKVLRNYEKNSLVAPVRSQGKRRLYSQQDVERLEMVHYLAKVRGINNSGIRLIMDLMPHVSPEKRNTILGHPEIALDPVKASRRS